MFENVLIVFLGGGIVILKTLFINNINIIKNIHIFSKLNCFCHQYLKKCFWNSKNETILFAFYQQFYRKFFKMTDLTYSLFPISDS